MYVELKTKPIKTSSKKTPNLKKKLTDILSECFQTKAFSTFPYIKDNLSSKKSIVKTNSGNCIALSMFIQDKLKRHGVHSCLIPATVPSYIYKDGYLEVCHVALVVPINESSYYLVDPAFYLMEPILVRMGKSISPVKSIDINQNKMVMVTSELKVNQNKTKLNEYQVFPKKTYYCECCYDNDKEDTWKYYLRELTNPDQSITGFFIKIRKDPFFVSTTLVDGMCIKDIVIRMNGDNISIKLEDTVIYDGSIHQIPNSIKIKMETILRSRGYDKHILSI